MICIFNKIFDANIKLLSGDTQNIRVYFFKKLSFFIFITTYIFLFFMFVIFTLII